MARPKTMTNWNLRIPLPVYGEVAGLAEEAGWAVNSELRAAVEYWVRLPALTREAARAWTKAHEKTGGARGLQGKPARPPLNGYEHGTLEERIQELEGQVAALREAVSA